MVMPHDHMPGSGHLFVALSWWLASPHNNSYKANIVITITVMLLLPYYHCLYIPLSYKMFLFTILCFNYDVLNNRQVSHYQIILTGLVLKITVIIKKTDDICDGHGTWIWCAKQLKLVHSSKVIFSYWRQRKLSSRDLMFCFRLKEYNNINGPQTMPTLHNY